MLGCHVSGDFAFHVSTALASSELFAQSVDPSTFDARPVVIKRMVTQGLAKTVNENLFQCEVPLRNYRRSAVGTITADNGRVLTVPAQTAYLIVVDRRALYPHPRYVNGIYSYPGT